MFKRVYPASPIATILQRIDLATGDLSNATTLDRASLVAQAPESVPQDAEFVSNTPDKMARAWAAAPAMHHFETPLALHVRRGAAEVPCRGRYCHDVVGLWWLSNRDLLVLCRTGPARARTALYRWVIDRPDAKRLLETDDLLGGCDLARNGLICVHESSARPRELVSIAPHSGRMMSIFDPNPEWNALRLGTVKRLFWPNDAGIETYGDLVLPAGTQAGTRLPLIIVQYDSRGFLRGGTGDEYPVQLLAAHGFAVLSFNRPASYGAMHGATSNEELLRLDQRDWSDRRSDQSSIATIVRRLVGEGIVDANRVVDRCCSTMELAARGLWPDSA